VAQHPSHQRTLIPPQNGEGKGWGLSALRKPIDPAPTPPLKGRGLSCAVMEATLSQRPPTPWRETAPSPPEGGEGGLVDTQKDAGGAEFLPGTGRGTIRRMVEGQVQSITTPKGQEDSPVPLPHASHGPLPILGRNFSPPL